MLEKWQEAGALTLKRIDEAQTIDALEALRTSVLGKKGELTELLKSLSSMSPEDRKKAGSFANQLKGQIEEALGQRMAALNEALLSRQLESQALDPTAPSRLLHTGSLHLISQVTERIVSIFARIGFDVTTGPEAETDFLNFEAVNIPLDHPARDMQDTFFLGPEVVLRTHTSGVQMRSMLAQKWPVRIVCPGTVYRCDNDATHSPMFHQIEGLWVDQGVKLSHLKGVLEYLAKELFGGQVKIRLRPSYFPFVEPGAEVDVSCFQCRKEISSTCRVCKGTGWLEILGAGMVHPDLFKSVVYTDPSVTGFAFGMGVERIAMLLHGIPDLRLLFQGDMRFLTQFSV